MSDTSNAARGAIAFFSAQISARLLALVFSLVAVRVIEPDRFGTYSIVAATVNLAAVLADFGTSAEVTRRVSSRPESANDELSVALPLSCALGIGAFAASMGVLVLARPGEVTFVEFAAGLAGLPFTAMLGTNCSALAGVGRLDVRAISAIIVHTVTLLGGTLALLLGAEIIVAIAFLSIGPLAGWATSLRPLRSTLGGRRYRWQTAGALLAAAAPLAVLAGISVIASRLDIVLVGAISGATAAAPYDLAVRVVEATLIVSAASTSSALYLLSRRLGTGDVDGAQRALDLVYRALVTVGIGGSAALVAGGDGVARWLFGSEYDDVGSILVVLGGQVWLMFAVGLLGTVLVAAGRSRAAIPVAASVTTITIVNDLLMIPRWDGLGAAVATAISSAVALPIFSLAVDRLTEFSAPRIPLPAVMLGVGAAALGRWVASAQVLVGIAAAMVTFIVGVAALRLVPASDLRKLAASMRGSAP